MRISDWSSDVCSSDLEMVKTLSSDAFEGRGPATAGEKKTIDYVVAQMQAAGVQPGGDVQEDGTRAWTPAVPLLPSDIAGPPALSVSVDGKTRAERKSVV